MEESKRERAFERGKAWWGERVSCEKNVGEISLRLRLIRLAAI